MSMIDYREYVYPVVLMALAAYREARGESDEAITWVCWVVRNRVEDNVRWNGIDYPTVVLKPYQFSSFNRNDPGYTVWPQSTNAAEWKVWNERILPIAIRVFEAQSWDDATGGCDTYHDVSIAEPEGWKKEYEFVRQIDRIRFYRPKPRAVAA